MSRTIIEESVAQLNSLIMQGQTIKGFEKYYDEAVVMQENELPPTAGKDANRQRELQFFGKISDFRKAEVLGTAVGEGVSYVTWHFDYTHEDWGVRNYKQVAVQTWKDGRIVKEQFFYGS